MGIYKYLVIAGWVSIGSDVGACVWGDSMEGREGAICGRVWGFVYRGAVIMHKRI